MAHLLVSKREPVFCRHVCVHSSLGTKAFARALTWDFLMTVGEWTQFWCKSCYGRVQPLPASVGTRGKGALHVWFMEAASACPLVVSGDLAVKLALDTGSPPGPLPPPCSSPDPQHVVFPLHSESHSKSKCFFLFETQKCKIAEISNISRSATIRPLCTKDQMINVHTYKNTVCITYVQYMCKMYGIQTWYGIDFRGANSKYKGIMVFLLKNNIKAIHEWTPDCHHFFVY